MTGLEVLVLAVAAIGCIACAVPLWAWATGRIVSRREMDARLANAMRELSDVVTARQSELAATSLDRDGWRNKTLDLEKKLFRTVETSQLLLDELKASRHVADGAGPA